MTVRIHFQDTWTEGRFTQVYVAQGPFTGNDERITETTNPTRG